MGKHYFHETESGYDKYARLIYCEWCGIVVFNFNSNDRTSPTIQEYQAKAGDGCKANEVRANTSPESRLAKGSYG
jgi:hypothetical protein